MQMVTISKVKSNIVKRTDKVFTLKTKLHIEDFSKIIFNKDKELNTATFMSFEVISNKDKNKGELWYWKTNRNISILVSSKIISIMVMELWLMMSENIKESFSMDKRTVLVSLHGLMDLSLKGGTLMTKNKAKENFMIKKESLFDKVFGKKITLLIDLFTIIF